MTKHEKKGQPSRWLSCKGRPMSGEGTACYKDPRCHGPCPYDMGVCRDLASTKRWSLHYTRNLSQHVLRFYLVYASYSESHLVLVELYDLYRPHFLIHEMPWLLEKIQYQFFINQPPAPSFYKAKSSALCTEFLEGDAKATLFSTTKLGRMRLERSSAPVQTWHWM